MPHQGQSSITSQILNSEMRALFLGGLDCFKVFRVFTLKPTWAGLG